MGNYRYTTYFYRPISHTRTIFITKIFIMKKNLLNFVVVIAFSFTTHLSSAQDPFVGEIRLFAGNFAPRGWAFCQGQLLPISQNTALFSLLGTTYGGDGRSTFALPDLRGRVPVGFGQGPGLSNYNLGQKSGTETVTLNISQLPAHMHTVENLSELSFKSSPADKSDTKVLVTSSTAGSTPAANVKTTSTGASQAISNVQPVLGMNYIIALQGIFPSRD
jgi:microcystin-dependent protein